MTFSLKGLRDIISISCSNLILPLIQIFYIYAFNYALSTQIQCKKMSTQKIPPKYTCILSILSIFLFYFSRRWHTILYPEYEWMVPMWSLFPNRSHWLYLIKPLLYTCFLDAQLSLILSYQFSLPIMYMVF